MKIHQSLVHNVKPHNKNTKLILSLEDDTKFDCKAFVSFNFCEPIEDLCDYE